MLVGQDLRYPFGVGVPDLMASKSGGRVLNDRQIAFCVEYLKDLNATQAAIRAGYSEKTARVIGPENLSKPAIAERIAKLVEERNERTRIDSDWVLRRLAQIADVDLAELVNDDGSVKGLDAMPEGLKRLIAGIEVTEEFAGRGQDREMVGYTKKVRLVDRIRVLELIGKHVGVSAFREHIHHSGPLIEVKDYTGQDPAGGPGPTNSSSAAVEADPEAVA
ncbi:MAG: terminase small subunit [Myxococcota bacterium]